MLPLPLATTDTITASVSAENDSSPADGLARNVIPDSSIEGQVLVRTVMARDIALSRKLWNTVKGQVIAGVPLAVLNTAVKLVSADQRGGIPQIKENGPSAAAASGLQALSALAYGVVSTVWVHYKNNQPLPENMTVEQFLGKQAWNAGLFSAGAGILFGWCFNMGGNLMAKHEITKHVMTDAAIDWAISSAIAATGGTAVVAYKYNKNFRDLVKSTLANVVHQCIQSKSPDADRVEPGQTGTQLNEPDPAASKEPASSALKPAM